MFHPQWLSRAKGGAVVGKVVHKFSNDVWVRNHVPLFWASPSMNQTANNNLLLLQWKVVVSTCHLQVSKVARHVREHAFTALSWHGGSKGRKGLQLVSNLLPLTIHQFSCHSFSYNGRRNEAHKSVLYPSCSGSTGCGDTVRSAHLFSQLALGIGMGCAQVLS